MSVDEAFIIRPKKKKGKITCCSCKISYSEKDYGILFDNKKIIYFRFKLKGSKTKKIYCHECLYVGQLKENIKKLRLIDENGEIYKCSL